MEALKVLPSVPELVWMPETVPVNSTLTVPLRTLMMRVLMRVLMLVQLQTGVPLRTELVRVQMGLAAANGAGAGVNGAGASVSEADVQVLLAGLRAFGEGG